MIEVDDRASLEAELIKNKRVLALFYASWCPYCMRFVPVFDKKVNSFSHRVIHVILDDYDNPLWDDYSVDAVPTAILFEDGKVCSRLDGKLGVGLSEKQLQAWMEKQA